MSEVIVDTREMIQVPTPNAKVTLPDLLTKAHEIQEHCFDFDVKEVSGKNFRFCPETAMLKYQPDNSDEARVKEFTTHSMSQLCTKIGVPNRYIDKCIKAGNIQLAAENMNSWIDEYGRSLFIREYGERVRAVLSDRYMVLDAPVILETLTDLVNPDDFTIRGFFLNEERFHARIVMNEMLQISGEDLFAGIQVDSSDVGRSIINIQFLIFKQVCTNGLIVSHADYELFKKRHLGNSQVDFQLDFQEAFTKLPELIDSVPRLVSNANKFDNSYDMSELVIEDKERKPTKVERLLKDRYRFSQKEVETVLTVMKRGDYPVSQWGFINSLTDAAKQFTLERRLEIEKVAGQLLMAA